MRWLPMRILAMSLALALAAGAPGDAGARHRRGRFSGGWSQNACPPGNFGYAPVAGGFGLQPTLPDPYAGAVGPYGEQLYRPPLLAPPRPAAPGAPAPFLAQPEPAPRPVVTSPPEDSRPVAEPKTVEGHGRPPAQEEVVSDGTRTVKVLRRRDGIIEIVP